MEHDDTTANQGLCSVGIPVVIYDGLARIDVWRALDSFLIRQSLGIARISNQLAN